MKKAKSVPDDKRHPLNLSFSSEEYSLLTAYAKEEGRSRANLAYILIIRAIREYLASKNNPS